MPTFDWLVTLLVIAGVIMVVMPTVGYLTLGERKISAWVQDRIGPNRVGPLGLLQPLADGGKFFLKEAPIPKYVDRIFYLLAPAVAMGVALCALAVVPWGGTTPPPAPTRAGVSPATALDNFYAEQTKYAESFQSVIAPGLDIGILYVLALGSLAVYAVILGGYSSNNKYSLLGSLRSSAQIISYEIPLGMSIVGVVLFAGSMNIEAIVAYQAKHGWFLLFQPLAFLLFMTSVYAECNRLPFDLPESEQELVGGYLTEYGSLNFGMFMLGEYTHMITTSLLMSLLFLGGWSCYGLEDSFKDKAPLWGFVLKAGILGAKMFFFLFLYLIIRWTIPRFRFDQLMTLAWKVMIPLSLLHLLAAMLVKEFKAPTWALGVASVGLFLAAGVVAVITDKGPNNTPRRRKVGERRDVSPPVPSVA